VWVVPPPTLSDEAIEAIFAELRGHLSSSEPYALVFDMTRTGTPTALQRRKVVAHMADNAPAIRLVVRGLAVIAPSAVLRGVITAIFWVAPPAAPYRIFDDRDEAAEWAESMAASPKASPS
jgi:hypothetical protein